MNIITLLKLNNNICQRKNQIFRENLGKIEEIMKTKMQEIEYENMREYERVFQK